MSNYYDDLGVARTATSREIHAAWRKRAVHLHPDQGGDAEAFKRVRVAYVVLSDPAARATYDQTGRVDPDLVTRLLHAVDPELLDVRAELQEGAAAVGDGRYLDAAERGLSLLRRGAKRFGWRL